MNKVELKKAKIGYKVGSLFLDVDENEVYILSKAYYDKADYYVCISLQTGFYWGELKETIEEAVSHLWYLGSDMIINIEEKKNEIND